MLNVAPTPSRFDVDHIASCAAIALTEELETYPKPGLVSDVDHGSHPELDAATFRASIFALKPYFSELAAAGERGAALSDLQRIGLRAEEVMMQATARRNTHRGAIFCLGLLSAAAGRQAGSGATLGEPIRSIFQRQWAASIPSSEDLPPESKGLAMCHRFRCAGVRGEARLAFPSVFEIGLPALRVVSPYVDRNAARVQTFFALLAVVTDTTTLARGGAEGLSFAQAQAREFLAAGGVRSPRWRQSAEEIHRAFVRRNLTSGGVADLLAATLFVAMIEPSP